jgi:hypothetical protein
MRDIMLALLLGAVLQSQGQKFPKVVGQLPRLQKELPGPGVCPKLPECFYAPEHIDKTFPSYGKAVMWFTLHHYCETVLWVTTWPEGEDPDQGPIRVQGNSMGAAINDLVRQGSFYWVLLESNGHYWMAGRPTEWTGIQ